MKVCMLSNCDITESLLYQERNHNFSFHNLGIAKMCSEPSRLKVSKHHEFTDRCGMRANGHQG